MQTNFIVPLFAAAALFAPGQAHAEPGEDAAALRAEISRMRAQLDQLETRLGAAAMEEAPDADASAKADAVRPVLAAPVTVPPASASSVTVKPRGRLQLDSNDVSRPVGINAPTLGWAADVRRAYLGVEGKLGGGFGYRLEVDVATGSAQFTDAWLTYGKGPLTVTLGHHRITSLEDVTSDLDTSMLERATFTQAFGMERRLGLSASYEAGDLLATAGIFADDLETLGAGGTANSYSLDGRLVYMPKLGSTQLHIGGSFHHRELNDLTDALRYRARPGARTTDVRFVDTGLFSATAETGYGLEFAAVHGPVHVAAEGFWQRVARPDLPAPTFFGGYGEIGYVFAGGTGRPYKKGVLGTIVPTRGLDKGGAGAWQINLRHDWLDLSDRGINGGTQRMFGASLVWVPVEHVKFLANYLRVEVRDTPVLAGGRSDYGANVFGLRAQYDF
ncbi:MAG TPA: porin [Sphingobium sp.]|nr:porin [Sphingobium sp.]